MASWINEATWDRVLRIILGTALLLLGWTGVVGGAVGVLFKIVGFVPLLTGIVGWCPAYTAFGVSTCRRPRVRGV